jgi:rsbT co-antagonist protein RsbR
MKTADVAVRVVLDLYHERMRLFQMVVQNAPDGIGVSNLDGAQIYPNPAFRELLGYGEELIGMHFNEYLENVDPEVMRHLGETGQWQGINNYRRKDGSSITCLSTIFFIPDDEGRPMAMGGFIRDMTDQLRAEQERMALQEQVIQAQQAALRELSTPLIPLADGIVAMPLVGTIDSRRAQQVVEELLQGVAGNRAATAIIDITGVPLVDTQVAGALMRAAQAVELLGARVILTGIRPEVAQTLVGIGVSLGSIVTRSNLQDGIAYALRTAKKR